MPMPDGGAGEVPAEARDAVRTAPVGLLTCHGTVARVDRATGQLIQARLWPVRDIATDWIMALPEGGLAAPMPSPADARVSVAPVAGTRLVTMQRGKDFLCAERDAGELLFNRQAPGPWEMFLPVTTQQLAALRVVLSHGWSEVAEGAPVLTPWLGDGLRLTIGAHGAALSQGVPEVSVANATIVLGGQVLRQRGKLAPPPEIELTRRPAAQQAPVVGDQAAFRAAPDARLVLQGAPEYGYLPLAASRAHETWMIRAWSQLGDRRIGRQRNSCQLVKERDKYVLMERWREGLIFDARGASNETAYLMGLNIAERGVLQREGSHIFATGQALLDAPVLSGPHAVFYGGNLSNYYHWLIDGLLPLHVMRPLLPPGTKLLLPGTLRRLREGPPDEVARQVDHFATLEAWGFGDMQVVEINAPVCRVETVYWLDQCFIEQMPADFVRAARGDVVARLGPAGPPKWIYLRRERTRMVDNAATIEQVARNHGFEVHELEGMTPLAQMRLFRDAEFVVAPHGAGLANLLFCAPGTKVLELAPDCEFRPLFAQISDKLGLTHAVLPCPTDDGGFFGRMAVDPALFRMLLRQLRARPVAA